jgi:chromosome segregation ATPase
MQKYRPVAMTSVLDNIQNIQHQVDAIRREIDTQNDWYKRFDGILDKHNNQIGDLLNGLSSEVKARERGEDSLSKAISGYTTQLASVGKTLSWLKGAAWVLGALLVFIAFPLLVIWISKMTGLIK